MTDLELKLFEMYEEERRRSDYLLDILLKKSGLTDEERDQIITVQGAPKFIGKIPWEEQKSRLEKRYGKKQQSGSDANGTDSISDEQSNPGEFHTSESNPEVTVELFKEKEKILKESHEFAS